MAKLEDLTAISIMLELWTLEDEERKNFTAAVQEAYKSGQIGVETVNFINKIFELEALK